MPELIIILDYAKLVPVSQSNAPDLIVLNWFLLGTGHKVSPERGQSKFLIFVKKNFVASYFLILMKEDALLLIKGIQNHRVVSS